MIKNQIANMQAGLQVRLLGQCETKWVDEKFEISRRQPRAILFRLATRLEPVSRSHLCLLLWPDTPEAEARRHLSNQIYNLRQALPEQGVIQASGDHLLLDSQRSWSDVTSFERLSQFSGQEELQQAVDLYRGSFLDSFWLADAEEFNLWADKERRHLEQRYLECLSKLISIHANQGDSYQAITYARRYLEIDELAEDIHRKLIDLYVAQGDRSAALKQYEYCATVLERELGVEPLPETREVYLAVLKDSTIRARSPETLFAWTTLPSLESPLVGREVAMAHLEEALSKTRTNSGSVVFVSGEAGVGKSRLLEDFVKEHVKVVGMVMIGSGYEGQHEVPYFPMVEALRPLLSSIDWGSLDVNPFLLAQLLPLLPDLRRYLPNLPDPSPVEHEESPVFQGLIHLVLSLTQQHYPLVLCLDDLHWADGTTLSWIGYLGRYLRDKPLLLLGGYRAEEADSLKSLQSDLARLNVLEEVQLEGLNERDVEQLIQHLSGQITGGERLSHKLHRLTGGNPFFLLETLRILLEEGAQDGKGWGEYLDRLSASLDDLHWPKGVTETIRQRVGRLRPTTAQVLQAGAVIGQNFKLDLVQEVSGRSEREVVGALEELTKRQLITDGEDWYKFRHDLIRDIVKGDLSYGRRRLLHRRTGEALEMREPENAATLARHFTVAGETQKAIDYFLQAGDRARSIFAHQEALDFYQRVLTYQKKNGMLKEAARTLMCLGLTYQMAYDFNRAQKAFMESFDLRQRATGFIPVEMPTEHCSLHLFVTGNLSTLDPGMPGARDIFIKKLFSGLLRSGPDWSVQPEVARTWEISDDGRLYIFHLRDDVRWSDGNPVTAHDFVFAWRRVLALQSGDYFPEMLYVILGARAYHQRESTNPDSVAIHARDKLTLMVDLEEPASYFLQLLTTPKMSPVPRHVVERYGAAWTEPDNMVTNGPFQLLRWEPGVNISLTLNRDYFGHFPGNLTQVDFTLYDDWSLENQLDQLKAYQNDQIDILPLGAETYHARHQHADEYHQSKPTKTVILGFGSVKSPVRDRRVRQALCLALDAKEFSRQMIPGFYIPANGGFLPPGFPGHSSEIGHPFHPGKARRLLDETGYFQGKSSSQLELVTPKIHQKQAQILKKIWEQNLGIQIKLNVMAWTDFMENRRKKPIFILGWGAYYYPDPDYFLRVGVQNLAEWWRHSGYERLIREATLVRDQDERLQLYQQADRILVEEAAIIPTVYQSEHFLIKPWINTNILSYYSDTLTDVIVEPH